MTTLVRRKRKTERNATVKKMRAKGIPLQDIAEHFHISRQRVQQILEV